MNRLIAVFFIPVLLLVMACQENKNVTKKSVYFPAKIGDFWGLVDTSGNLISQPVFSSIGYFYNGLALVTKDNKASYMNDSGKVIADYLFLSGTHFNEGLAFVVSTDHVISCIDTSLNQKFSLKDIDHAEIFSCGLAAVHKLDKYGYLDKSGKMKIDFFYDVVTGFSDDIAAVGINDASADSSIVNWFYIDKNGNKLFDETFDSAIPFHEGKAAVQNDIKMHWIDKTGKKLFNAEFDECRSFHGGFATFRSGDKWGIIRADGKIILEPSYPFVGNFSENFFPFSLGPESYGYLDTTGNIKIQPKYKAVSAFKNGFSYILQNAKLGILSKVGVETCYERFDSAPGYFGAMLGFIDTPLNSSVDNYKSDSSIISQ